jgi:hypothetical protein
MQTSQTLDGFHLTHESLGEKKTKFIVILCHAVRMGSAPDAEIHRNYYAKLTTEEILTGMKTEREDQSLSTIALDSIEEVFAVSGSQEKSLDEAQRSSLLDDLLMLVAEAHARAVSKHEVAVHHSGGCYGHCHHVEEEIYSTQPGKKTIVAGSADGDCGWEARQQSGR